MKSLLRKSLALAAALAISAALPVTIHAQEAPAAAETTELEQVLGTVNGRSITVEDLDLILSARRPPGVRIRSAQMYLRLAPAQQEEILKELALQEAAADRARAEGATLNDEQKAAIESQLQRRLTGQLYGEEIESRLEAPTEEEILAAYEEFKDSRFKIEPYIRFRTLYLSAYEPYVVKEGDTLESIAAAVSGDASRAAEILTRDTDPPTPRIEAREVKTTDEATAEGATRALVAGEALLVRMSPEARKRLKERASAFKAQVDDAHPFVMLAEQHSETSSPGGEIVYRPKSADRPYHPDIMKAIESQEPGVVSDPIETRHGIHMVMVVSRQEEGYRALEEVRSTVERLIRNRDSEAIVNEYLERVSKPLVAKFEVDMDALAKGGPEGTPDSEVVVLRFGDFTVSRAQYREALPAVKGFETKELVAMTREQVLQTLPTHPATREAIISQVLKDEAFAEREENKSWAREAETGMLAQDLISRESRSRAPEVTDEDLARIYGERKDTLFTERPAAQIHIMRVTEEELKSVPEQREEKLRRFNELARDLFAGVENSEQFAEAAKRGARLMRGVSETNLGRSLLSAQESDFARALEAGRENELLGPITNVQGVTYAWMSELTPERVMPFEEATDRLRQIAESEAVNKGTESIREELLATASWSHTGEDTSGSQPPLESIPSEMMEP
ncbi:MAG: peptidyl-prolyl cis-trans isomerase [Candidatus Sumerlaeia bacterium]|nr:peptidyl-prolyl cis-trans isomerase [Candidatus Sumerlaeia bacterium]